MSLSNIRKALGIHLAAMRPKLEDAAENVKFEPKADCAYQRTNLMPAQPDNSTLGGAHYREIGIFQTMLCYPQNKGPVDAQARADAVRTWFKRGTTLEQSGTRVVITHTPQIGPSMVDGDRFCIPVMIRFQADIFN